VQSEGTIFIRGNVAQVTDNAVTSEEKGKLVVVAEDTLTRTRMRVPVDMVVLSVGLQPAEDADAVARMLGISQDLDGWFNELHPKLAPVSTPTDGVFIAGCCQGPKDIPDTVSQASGAAAEALSLMMRGKVEMEAATSYINPSLCVGCRQCMDICMYGAIDYIEPKNICEVNTAVCKGCGLCAATCPSKAVTVKHFNNDEIFAEIEAFAV
jgi:heterodisulfide reductase subunit A